MNTYIEKLKTYSEEQKLNFSGYDAQSLIEILYYFYSGSNDVDGEKVKAGYAELERLTAHLPYSENNAIFTTVNSLFAEQEKEAFVAGVRVGVQLALELQP